MNSKAFTLAETLIVIAILAIIAAAIYGTISSLGPSLKLKSAARDLATDLRYSQQQAVTEQINFGILLFSETNQYQVVRYGTTTETISTKLLPTDIVFQEITGFTDDKVIFNPYGAVQEMGAISLTNNKAETKTIEIRPSGFVRIK